MTKLPASSSMRPRGVLAVPGAPKNTQGVEERDTWSTSLILRGRQGKAQKAGDQSQVKPSLLFAGRCFCSRGVLS